jgi:hypothetical protein
MMSGMDSLITARWRTWAETGSEHLVLRTTAAGVSAEGVVLAGDADPFAARYRIACDPQWRVRAVDVAMIGGAHGMRLTSDGAGNWTDSGGAPLTRLRGAIDVDLSASPFTNTLPIRRLRLARGQSADILAAYVAFPELTVTIDRQRYTCLEPNRRYRYESLASDFSRDIEVDGDGLVVTYPGLFRRTL